jgi:hypothetical protein
VPKFADRGCHVVSVTDPYGHILGFPDLKLSQDRSLPHLSNSTFPTHRTTATSTALATNGVVEGVSAQYSNATIIGREHYLNINIFHRRAVSSFLYSERKVISRSGRANRKLINMFTKAATGPYPAAAPYVLAYSS